MSQHFLDLFYLKVLTNIKDVTAKTFERKHLNLSFDNCCNVAMQLKVFVLFFEIKSFPIFLKEIGTLISINVFFVSLFLSFFSSLL